MKKLLVVMLVLGLASAANADLSLVGADAVSNLPVGGSGAVNVASDADGGYACWLEIPDLGIATYTVDFTAGGNPNGDSVVNEYAGYDGWFEVIVASLNPSAPVVAGDHIVANITGVAMGETVLNLYADDGATLLDSIPVVVPEPMTIALLGLGGLFLRRRR